MWRSNDKKGFKARKSLGPHKVRAMTQEPLQEIEKMKEEVVVIRVKLDQILKECEGNGIVVKPGRKNRNS